MGFVGLVEAILELFGLARAGFFGVVNPADDERDLNGRQFALQHLESRSLGVHVQLTADFAYLDLLGLELSQSGGFLGNEDVFHLLEERRAAVVVRVPRVQEIDVNRPFFKDPRPYAGRLFLQPLDALGFVLGLGIDEQVALLGGGEEVNQGVGRIQVELDRIVVHRDDVGQQFFLGVAEQAAEQPGIRGDGVIPDDESGADRHVVSGELAPFTMEFHVVTQEEGPLCAVLVGFPAGRQAGHQGAVKPVGVHQRIGEGPDLGVRRRGGPKPRAGQLLHRRNRCDTQASAERGGFLRGCRRVRGTWGRRSDNRWDGGCRGDRSLPCGRGLLLLGWLRLRLLLLLIGLRLSRWRRRSRWRFAGTSARDAYGQQHGRGGDGNYCRPNQFVPPELGEIWAVTTAAATDSGGEYNTLILARQKYIVNRY